MHRFAAVIVFTACTWLGGVAACAAAGVQMTEDATGVTLANAEVTLRIDKQSARLRSLKFKGRELIGRGVGYVQIAGENGDAVQWQLQPARPGLEGVDLAFVNASARFPFELETHYVLRPDEAGFHVYFVLGHDASKHPGVITLEQLNYCLRVDPDVFTTAAVDDQHITPFPPPGALKGGQTVMDATVRMADGTVYSKYFYSAPLDEEHRVHGAMGGGTGLWVIMPSHEHVNGGPEHQELTVHQTDTTPVLLWMFLGGHYGAGGVRSDSRDGSWTKAGSAFFHVNAGQEPRALWADAKRRAAKEATGWPYAWLDDARFELQRGGVNGTLRFEDRAPAADARVILAPHEDSPSPLLWQQRWRGYRFSGRTDAAGRFAIGNVRAGVYDLYAWKAGVFGAFAKTALRVEKGQTTDAGDLVWPLPPKGEVVWQIGVPDRSAAEFGGAENFRRWGLWDEIASRYPGGVRFVVGKSAERDLPFEMAVTQNADLSWRTPVWRVEFARPAAGTGEAILTVGLAESESVQMRGGPRLKISLNGEEIAELKDLASDGAAHRSGIFGLAQERRITFDAAKLKPGQNALTIELLAPPRPVVKALGYPGAAVMFDALRLEVRK